MYLGIPQPQPQPAPPPQPLPGGWVIGPAVPVIPIGKLACGPGQIDEITKAVGQQASAAAVKRVMEEDGAETYYTLVDSHLFLKSPRTAATRQLFGQVFGVAPELKPYAGAAWDLGRVVAERFLRTHQMTVMPGLEMSCWGWPWPSATADAPFTYRVRAEENVPKLALGLGYWRDRVANDLDSLGAAVLGGALTIRYGLSWNPIAPPIRNVHCYLRFAFEVQGRTPPAWIRDNCSHEVARAHRAGPLVA